MNAIALLKADHRSIEELFEKLDRLAGSSRGRSGGKKAKRSLVERLIRELSVHSAIEEEVFYPRIKQYVPDAAEQVLESLEFHNVAKWVLFALESMDAGDERFEAKIRVLKDTVMHHFDAEESELFPRVRDAFDNATLNALGTLLERAKRTAPTHPHPRAPDEPPANLFVNMGTSVIDRIRDTGKVAFRTRNGGRRAAAERVNGRASAKPKRANGHAGRASRAHAR
jgi:hemerythrin superfamily protein